MKIERAFIPPAQPFVEKYESGDERVCSLFDYSLDETSLHNRAVTLNKRSFPREELSDHIQEQHQKWGICGEEIKKQLKKLEDPQSVCIVGGQQAGLLGGPLYTAAKAITIIQEAEKWEKKLQKPVVPVFWIAGEDHDIQEVNHIYVPTEKGPKKHKLSSNANPRIPMSDQSLNPEGFRQWLRTVAAFFPETSETKKLIYEINQSVKEGSTWTDHFASWFGSLFAEKGLLMLDAHHPKLRELEKDIFALLIEQNEDVTEALHKGVKKRQEIGFASPLQVQNNTAHFFYHMNSERELMFREESGHFIGKYGRVKKSKQELMADLSYNPSLFSTNVATRPVVQEHLLPVLTFIAGPGEVDYWSILTPLFHVFGFEMPPITPRYRMTFIDRATEWAIKKEELSPEEIIKRGASSQIEQRLKESGIDQTEALVSEVKAAITNAHQPLVDELLQVESSHQSFADKNRKEILHHVDQLGNKINELKTQNVSTSLSRLKKAEFVLRPHSQPQERVWSLLFLLNQCGIEGWKKLLSLSWLDKSNHLLIYL